MLSREEAMIRKIDFMKEEFSSIPPWGEPEDAHPERPIAFRFHFVEVCGGAGKVSKFLAEMGWTIGPVLDLDLSPHYDFAGLRLLQWIFFMIERGRLDSLMLEPPCTTFSPAQHPASRSYEKPRGFDPLHPKTSIRKQFASNS